FTVMRRQGLVGRLGMLPRLSLALESRQPPEPVVVAPTFPGWRPVSGFDHWEGPYPERALGMCRWAHGPVARLEAQGRPGAAQLLIRCRCYQIGQRVHLVHAGRVVGEHEVLGDEHDRTDRVLAFDVHLSPGPNTFEIHSWKWSAGPRPMALLV